MTRKELTEELKKGLLTPVMYRDLNRELQAQYPETDSETVIGYYIGETDWFIDD